MNITASTTEDYYYRALKLISYGAPKGKNLLDSEAALLAKFLDLPPKERYYPFSTKARKMIAALYVPTVTKQALSQKITSMVNKGYLIRDEDNFIDFNPVIKKLLKHEDLRIDLLYRPAD